METSLDVSMVFRDYADLVFRALQWLGARRPEAEDLSQEVFLVVHQKLHTFDRNRPIEPWLFGICKNVSSQHRKKSYVRREIPTDEPPDESSEGVLPNPEEALVRHRRRAVLDELLDELDLDTRALLVMFEIDGMPCAEIAKVFDIPKGTVHSRLDKARKDFQAAIQRRNARLSRGGRR